ncbi:MAG: ribosome maturation factor RimM [Acidimicrobiales bacterium]|nr:ribosome maturation factor RimM [Acidimicrobiales bacterium]
MGRPHALRGEITVTLTTNRTERLDVGSVLHCDAGRLVVEAARPHQGKWLVKFDGYPDRTAVETLIGREPRAEPIHDPDELWVHELIGATVVEADGTERGEVVAVLDNPASDLLELDTGFLVPVVFVTALVPNERVTVEAPAGLFDPAEALDARDQSAGD